MHVRDVTATAVRVESSVMQWRRRAWAVGLSPQNVAYPHQETYANCMVKHQKVNCAKFSIFDHFCSHNYNPQIKISGAATLLYLDISSLHRVSKKLCKIVLSELRQISTNFDNFWQKDGKRAEIMRGALIFHLI